MVHWLRWRRVPDISIAKAICIKFEGCRSKPYLDPVGLPTIGYGTRFYADGTEVALKDRPITQAEADTLLTNALQKHYLPELLEVSPSLKRRPKALNGILSFCYNMGVRRYKKSTLRRYIDAGDFAAAKTEILKWNHAGKTVLPGLTARRKAESELIGAD